MKSKLVAKIVLCMAYVFSSFCLLAEESNKYHVTKTPKTLSEWRDAEDGKISACFVTDKTTFSTNETIVVRCAVRNNTDKQITILRPF
jgi:hypothetical protein